MHEERNTSLLHDLELEDRLKDKEDERKYFKEQTDQKENELAMRINYLERQLKEEMKLNEPFLLEAAQTLKMTVIFLKFTWTLSSLSHSSVFGFEEQSFVDRKIRQVGMKLR